MHAGDDLLADIAALLEIDAIHHVQIDVMHEDVAIGEIDAALRHALSNAMRLIALLARTIEARQGLVRRDEPQTHAGRAHVAINGALRPLGRPAAENSG